MPSQHPWISPPRFCDRQTSYHEWQMRVFLPHTFDEGIPRNIMDSSETQHSLLQSVGKSIHHDSVTSCEKTFKHPPHAGNTTA